MRQPDRERGHESGQEPQDAAVSNPPTPEQAHDDTPPPRTPGLGPDHQHRLAVRPEEA